LTPKKYGTTTSVSADVLVDISAWIGFFRGNEPAKGKILRLIDDDRVCCTGLIIGEMLQWAINELECSTARGFLTSFPIINESHSTWINAGELSSRLRRAGRTVGLADCLLAAFASEHNQALLTHDRHFGVIKEAIGLDLEPFDQA
jgi:hypothetical protein